MNANAERAEAAGTLALFAEAQHSVDAYLTMDNRVEVVATDHADAATKTFTSTAAVPGLVGANATDYAVRVTWNADVGVGFSYVRVSGDTADTAPTYGPLGTTVTTGIEPVILSRTQLRVGADSAGVDEMSGRVYLGEVA